MHNQNQPLVSCILATYDRREFLAQAIKFYKSQSYPNKELVILDDGPTFVKDFTSKKDKIIHLRLEPKCSIGKKLNKGIEASSGRIIQKIDDDDYYHRDFLRTTVSRLIGHDTANTIVCFDFFCVLILKTGEIKTSGNGWCAGGTLCFYKDLWDKTSFREDMNGREDWQFLMDHRPRQVKIKNPELYIMVRHDIDHGWTEISGMDVTAYFSQMDNYHKDPIDIMGKENWAFYQELRKRLYD